MAHTTRRYSGPSALAFSPDARTLAYVSDRSGTYCAWTIPLAGGQPSLALAVDGGAVRSLCWSPSGDLIGAVDRGGTERWQLYVTRSDERIEPLSVSDGDAVQHLLSWNAASPDGRFLAISSNARERADVDLVVIDTKTKEQRALLTGPYWHVAGGWSPDGRSLLAMRERQHRPDALLGRRRDRRGDGAHRASRGAGRAERSGGLGPRWARARHERRRPRAPRSRRARSKREAHGDRRARLGRRARGLLRRRARARVVGERRRLLDPALAARWQDAGGARARRRVRGPRHRARRIARRLRPAVAGRAVADLGARHAHGRGAAGRHDADTHRRDRARGAGARADGGSRWTDPGVRLQAEAREGPRARAAVPARRTRGPVAARVQPRARPAAGTRASRHRGRRAEHPWLDRLRARVADRDPQGLGRHRPS